MKLRTIVFALALAVAWTLPGGAATLRFAFQGESLRGVRLSATVVFDSSYRARCLIQARKREQAMAGRDDI